MKSTKIYCAFCKIQRSIYGKSHISGVNIVLSLLCAVLLSLIVFESLDPRAIIFFILAIAVTEVFVIFRRRISVVCPHCGFDPMLYKKDHGKAAERVKQVLAHKKKHKEYMFSTKNPFKNIKAIPPSIEEPPGPTSDASQ